LKKKRGGKRDCGRGLATWALMLVGIWSTRKGGEGFRGQKHHGKKEGPKTNVGTSNCFRKVDGWGKNLEKETPVKVGRSMCTTGGGEGGLHTGTRGNLEKHNIPRT